MKLSVGTQVHQSGPECDAATQTSCLCLDHRCDEWFVTHSFQCSEVLLNCVMKLPQFLATATLQRVGFNNHFHMSLV